MPHNIVFPFPSHHTCPIIHKVPVYSKVDMVDANMEEITHGTENREDKEE